MDSLAETVEATRTCVGCREKDSREALLRLSLVGEPPRLVPDPKRRLGGRGVSVHPRPACIRNAVRRGGFARSLRSAVSIQPEELSRLASQHYRRRAEALLLSAMRANALVVGTDAVRGCLRDQSGESVLLLAASDAAGRSEELRATVSRMGGMYVAFGTKTNLGRLLGRGEVGVIAVTDPRLATLLAEAAANATTLSEDE